MNRLRMIPLDDTVVFPGMPATLSVDLGSDDRVLLVSRHEHHTLAVRSIAIDVTPKTGACPRTEYTFTATIVGDGQAGVARLRWLRPDGQPTAVQSMRVPSHRPAHATLRFLIDGTASTPVVASLELLSPTSRVVASPTAQYTCA